MKPHSKTQRNVSHIAKSVFGIFHDIKDILGYPNEIPPKWEKNIPKFIDGTLCAILHISSFLDYVSNLNKIICMFPADKITRLVQDFLKTKEHIFSHGSH